MWAVGMVELKDSMEHTSADWMVAMLVELKVSRMVAWLV